MLKILSNTLLISTLFIFFEAGLLAQPKDNSPFSQFGVGDFIDNDMVSSHAMGGLGSVYHDFFEANLDNPASLGFLQYTSFQIGLHVKRSSYKRFDQKETVWSGNLDHLSLNIPLINPLNEALERRETKVSWGTSISLRPYSQVGYNVRIIDDVDSIGPVKRSFTGSGGLYQLNIGNGIKYKNLSAGINLTYIYGKQLATERTQFLSLYNSYDNLFTTSIAYKGFQYRLGLIYEQPIDLKKARSKHEKPSKLLSAGVYLGSQSSFDTKTIETEVALNELTNDSDTIYTQKDYPGVGTLPGGWGFGLMYHQAGTFRVGLDYQASGWNEYTNEAHPDTTKNTWRIGAGAAWIPDANSITAYFKRVEYRAGFYTKADPRVIEGSQVKETAFTMGAAFPLIMQRNIAWLQIGLDIGKRTGGENLRDSFVRAKVGFVVNDNSWFIKGKYD